MPFPANPLRFAGLSAYLRGIETLLLREIIRMFRPLSAYLRGIETGGVKKKGEISWSYQRT